VFAGGGRAGPEEPGVSKACASRRPGLAPGAEEEGQGRLREPLRKSAREGRGRGPSAAGRQDGRVGSRGRGW